MSTYRVLFIGDVVGKPGRRALEEFLPGLVDDLDPLFVIVNGENAAAGVGITSDIADDFLKLGVDAITLGNHAFQKRDVHDYLNTNKPIVRPYNAHRNSPGRGVCTVTKGDIQLAVINICGRVFLDGYDDPFAAIDEILPTLETSHILVDFHAEATSEKIAFGYHLDGRASMVLGTHTHVTTADERILPNGTAVITDVGMTGPPNGVLGMDRGIILRRFLTGLPERFEVASGSGVICGVIVDVERVTGRAVAIQRVRREDVER
ncbi:MAG: TIGR00282 family metallophosphoesterase [Fimbriimonadaceae bacterium]|nr:TIGR00282 family metallophosphoesterase [Fimbriimonadaceae bacterium]